MSLDQIQPPTRVVILRVNLDGRSRHLQLICADGQGSGQAILDGRTIDLDLRLIQPGILSLLIEGRSYRCVLNEGPTETNLLLGGKSFLFQIEDPRSLAARRGKRTQDAGRQTIKAPMPGRIVRLLVACGEKVEAHQGVIVVEAMKMQNELKAARAGTVVEIRTQADRAVTPGEILLVIE